MSSENVKFEPNKTYTITSQIFGTGDIGEIVWTIQGVTSNDTLIDQNGNLTIGKDEKAKEIVIVATSSKNPEIYSTITIHIEKKQFKYLYLGYCVWYYMCIDYFCFDFSLYLAKKM